MPRKAEQVTKAVWPRQKACISGAPCSQQPALLKMPVGMLLTWHLACCLELHKGMLLGAMHARCAGAMSME